jgi:ABC-2 type transport system permease protein
MATSATTSVATSVANTAETAQSVETPMDREFSGIAQSAQQMAMADNSFPSVGLRTLFKKEVLRFWKVSGQTVTGPVLTALLYLLIFSHALGDRVSVYPGITYTMFLVPGLAMMSVLQNSFANASSSLIQSKITGNLVFILLPPLTHLEIFLAYVGAAMVRGVVVGVGVFLAALLFAVPPLKAPLWALAFLLMGSALMGALGLLAGIWAEKFDQMAAFQNFLVAPATFLSGVFYSIHTLPAFWQKVSHLNPFFYMIDGFRHGFFGVSDVSPWLSLAVVGITLVVLSVAIIRLLASGYKLRH